MAALMKDEGGMDAPEMPRTAGCQSEEKGDQRMKRKQIFLWIQTLLVILICVLLAAGAIGIYREGMQARAADVTAWIYTKEIVAGALEKLLPAIIGTAALVIIGQFAGRKGQDGTDAGKPLSSKKDSRTAPASGKAASAASMEERPTAPASGIAASMEERRAWYSSGTVRPTRRSRAILILLILIAAGCIIFGILNGSSRDVLIKAAAVCTECIGLG